MIATLALVLALGGTVPDQQPAREGRSAPASGTAVISGRVVSADAEPKPVRRARVMLNSSDREVGRTAITDDAGMFSFTALPAARYSLSAMKAGFVTVSYGEKRPGRPGTAIPLNDAQRVAGLILRMHRGAVITGTVLGSDTESPRAASPSVRCVTTSIVASAALAMPARPVKPTTAARTGFTVCLRESHVVAPPR